MKTRGLFHILFVLALLTSGTAYGQTTADLTLQVRATPAPQFDQAVAYTLELRNYGPATATNVLVQDSFEPPFNTADRAIDFLDVRPSQGWYDDGSGIWNVGALPYGERATLLVTVRMRSALTHRVKAEVIQVDQTDPDSTPANQLDTEDDFATVTLVPGVAPPVVSPVMRPAPGTVSQTTQTSAYYEYEAGLVNPLPTNVLAARGLPARVYNADGVQLVHTVDKPEAQVGELVTITVDVHANTLDTTDVDIESLLPKGVEYVASEARIVRLTSQGEVIVPLTGQYDTATGYIKFADLYTNAAADRAYGQLFLTARVIDTAPVQSCARVLNTSVASVPICEAMCSTINNERYKYAKLVSGNCCGYASSALAAGIESNGFRAVEMAQRLFTQRNAAAALTVEAGFLRDLLAPFYKAGEALGLDSAEGAAPTRLNTLLPETGPNRSRAHVSTPQGLIGLTNARHVFGVNYMADGKRLGAAFAAATPTGVIYDHTKVTCDRLAGAHLESVQTLYVHGHPFVLSQLVHPDGATDFAVSFVAYRRGDRYTVDSRFATREYFAPSSGDEVLNFQVWAADPAHTETLVAETLDRIQRQGDVKFLNTRAAQPAIPRVYVKNGRYEDGRLWLDIVNEARANELYVDGDIAKAENGARTPFSRTLRLNPSQTEQTVVLDLGSVFDITFHVTGPNAGGTDQLYYSDGAWSYAQGDARVWAFEADPAPLRMNDQPHVLRVERAASLEGEVTSWASLFRQLRSKGAPADLSRYSHVEFTASGQGRVRLVLENSTTERYEYALTLTDAPRRYRIALSQLQGRGRFDGSDVTLIAFRVDGNGRTAQPFRVAVEDVAFTAGNVSQAAPAPGRTGRRIR